MGYIEDAERLIEHVKQIKQTGASATQEQANPPADIGIFADGYPEWVQDDGLEELYHISYYPKTRIVYQCINPIQRFAQYTPDVATNNYNPYPEPDEDGVFPYVYGMGVKIGMRERDPNGNVYVAIQAMTKQLNPPSELAAIFQIEG